MSKKVNFKFVEKHNSTINNGDYVAEDVVFYQLATFPNPKKQGYHIRRYIIDGNNNYVSVKEKYFKESEYIHFIETTRPNIFRRYSTFNLNEVSQPTMGDISLARSDILK